MAGGSYTYDALPAEVRKELPEAGGFTAAMDWTKDPQGVKTAAARLPPFAVPEASRPAD